MTTNLPIQVVPLAPEHFDGVVRLGNAVHGDGYLDDAGIRIIAAKGIKDGINCSYVAMLDGKVVGFRLTYAIGHWQPDHWCSPELWPLLADKVCYFKCNTVDEAMRGQGLGSRLLAHSIAAARRQGAEAGLAHIWRQSPGNSAYLYFSKCGGQVIADHPGKWRQDSLEGYDCVICGSPCSCTAAEMLIDFRNAKEG